MSIEEKVDKILKHVEKIDRGVYGDPDNGVDGLMKENKNQEEKIKQLQSDVKDIQKFNKDLKWWIGKIAAGVSIIIGGLWTLIKQRFGL